MLVDQRQQRVEITCDPNELQRRVRFEDPRDAFAREIAVLSQDDSDHGSASMAVRFGDAK
jgi:hypothetical protein